MYATRLSQGSENMNKNILFVCLIILLNIQLATAVAPQVIDISSVTTEQTLKYDNVLFTTFNTSADNYITEIKITVGSAPNQSLADWLWLNENFGVTVGLQNGFAYTTLYNNEGLLRGSFSTKYAHFEKFNGTNITGDHISGIVFSQNATKFLFFKPKPEVYIKYNIDTGITTYTFEPTLILTYGGLNNQGDFLENTTDFYSGMPSQSMTIQSTQLLSVELKVREKGVITLAEQANALSGLSKFIYKFVTAIMAIVTLGKITDSSVLLYFLLFLDTLFTIMIFFIELFFFKFYLVLMYIIIIGNFWCGNRAINLHSLLQEYQQYYKAVFSAFYTLFTYMYGIVLYIARLIRG
jgi:hypothetical protein